MAESNGINSSQRAKILLILYPQLSEDGKVDTLQFLEASKSVIRIYDTLGAALIVAKKDMQGNVEKLMEVYRKAPDKYKYLNDLIYHEKDDTSAYAINSMLWLKRGLEFTIFFVKRLIEDFKVGVTYESIAPIVEEGYNKILKPYHNFLIQNLFKVLFKAFPHRATLLAAIQTSYIGSEYSMEECIAITSDYFMPLETNLQSIIKTYKDNGLVMESLQL